MFQIRLSAFYSILILATGLISCSSDKEVQVQPDNFKTGEVSSIDSTRSFRFGTDIKSLSLSDELTIEDLKDKDFGSDPIYFTVDTQCRDIQNRNSFRKEYIQTNSATFSVLKLIPEDILLLTQPSPVICDFTLTAKNSLSSLSITQLNNVTFLHPDDLGPLKLGFLLEDGSVFAENTETPIDAPEKAQVRVSCDDFGAIQDVGEQPVTLKELVGANATLPLKVKSPSQKCRVLVRHGKDITVSPLFTLKMPALPVVTTAEFIPQDNFTDSYYERDVLKVTFTNPNAFPVKLRLDRNVIGTYDFQYMEMRGGSTVRLTPLTHRAINWRLETSRKIISSTEEALEIELEGQKDTVWVGSAPTNMRCSNRYGGGIGGGGSQSQIFIGQALGFHLENQFQLTTYPGIVESVPLNIQGVWSGTSPHTPLTLWDIQYNKIAVELNNAYMKGRAYPERGNDFWMGYINPHPTVCQEL